LRHRAAGDGYDIVFDRGDRALHAHPDANGEAFVHRVSDLLLVLDGGALGDERLGGLEEATAQRQVHAQYLTDERDYAFFGGFGLYLGVLLALRVLRDEQEPVGRPAHVGIARTELLDAHLV
jgi:hypothetical protein